MNRQMNIS